MISHDRSFKYMTVEELAIKRQYDQHRLDILNRPVLEPLRNYGRQGLDETLYGLGHKIIPFQKQATVKELEAEIGLVNDELYHRFSGDIEPKYKRILEVKANPATFNVLRSEAKNLRKERIMDMKNAGVDLFPEEYATYLKEKVSQAVAVPLDMLGSFGQTVKDNMLLIGMGGMIVATLYTGKNWVEQSGKYDVVAKEYMSSHEVGANTLPLKRDVPESLTWCTINLTHTPEIKIKMKDSTITIPEKPSSPVLGRANIQTMMHTVETNLSDYVINSFETVDSTDKNVLRSHRNSAMANFINAHAQLLGQTRDDITYVGQIAIAAAGQIQVDRAVGVLESYMDEDVVEKENSAYADLAFWKWFTIINGAVSGILGFSAYRNDRNQRWRSIYY